MNKKKPIPTRLLEGATRPLLYEHTARKFPVDSWICMLYPRASDRSPQGQNVRILAVFSCRNVSREGGMTRSAEA